MLLSWLVAALLGLVVGSFLNVVIYRLPRNESIVAPGSYCPECGVRLVPQDLIPVYSYLALKGKCRYCREPISWEYPLVEMVNALLYLLLFSQFRFQPQFWIFAAFFSGLVVLSFIDFHHGILPNVITIPGILVGLAWGGFNDLWHAFGRYPISLLYNLGTYVASFSFLNAALGVLVGGGIVLLVVILSKGGMGLGDVKLNAMVGAFLGWQAATYNLFLAAVLGSVVGIFLMATGKKGRKDAIPFGPYLALGAIILTLYRG
ncbi:MAG: prepilin peptidase [Firmicutes bacterium]|nr:prepilin peptidase [Bacillota bacterium]